MKSFKFFSVPEHHITKFDVEPITVIGQTWHDARNISFRHKEMTWSTELVLAAHAKTQATFMNSFDLRCSLAFFAIITSAQLFIYL